MARKRETLASEDISDLPPPTHRHPMSGEPIWDQHAVRALVSTPVAPWPDYAGNPIRHNDRIRHPDGTEGIVWHMDGHKDANDAWRVLYVQEGEIACLSRLNLQIGEKGQAVVVAAASEPAPPQASTIAWDAAQAMADELEVADLLAGFGQDPTGDHAVMVVRAVMERTKGQIAEAVLKFVQATDALHEAIERKTWTSGFKKEMTAGERIRCWSAYREAREELIALLKD